MVQIGFFYHLSPIRTNPSLPVFNTFFIISIINIILLHLPARLFNNHSPSFYKQKIKLKLLIGNLPSPSPKITYSPKQGKNVII